MTSRKWLLGTRSRRFIYLCFRVMGALLNLIPRRAVFLMLVISDAIELQGRGRLFQAYFPHATSYVVDEPGFRFASALSRRFDISSARVLQGIGAYREASDWIVARDLAAVSPAITYALARSLFELGDLETAQVATSRLRAEDLAQSPDLAVLKAMLDISVGDEQAALQSFQSACDGRSALLRPHQNIAARSTFAYVPNELDALCGAMGRQFDLCNFAGQRATHVGRGEIGIQLFARALDAQRHLRFEVQPRLSPDLTRFLEALDVSLDELRLIPEEWTTQIGHLGMLDILFRMRGLGWWGGKAVIVVRPGLIANRAFFRLFEESGNVVVIGETVSERVGEELLSLQRWYGLNFNAFQLPDGTVVPWQEAGALAIAQWEREGRGHPLRDTYDRVFGEAVATNEAAEERRVKWGMKSDDWYVCFHTRDAGHYFEFKGTGQTHRNAPIETSLEAIRDITAKGGWVIKLGGPNSPKLPQLARTIDYALGGFRTDLMDLHLIRHARAFVGTTSGLTNVAVSFGIPCAIVNAITTDAQLWHRDARFALKPVHLADGAVLTQRQLTSSPWRWRLFDAAVLGRHGAHPENNSSDEILETVKEAEALGSDCAPAANDDAEPLIVAWRRQLSLANYYGTGRPSLYYLRKHETDFLAESRQGA